MPLIYCSECGKQISDSATACPNCGKPSEKVVRDKAGKQVAGWIIVGLGIGFDFFVYSQPPVEAGHPNEQKLAALRLFGYVVGLVIIAVGCWVANSSKEHS